MANVLSSLKVILGIETAGFPGVRQQVRGLTQGVQREFAQLKTFVGGFFTARFGMELVRSVTQMAERFKDLSEQSGESLETIQKYDQVFKRFGSTAEDAIKIFDELALAREEAMEGKGDAGIRLQNLGLSVEEIHSLETGRQLYERIAQIANNPANAQQRVAFLETFGRKRGGKALAGAAALAEGGQFSLMSDEQIKQLDAAAKAFEKAALEFKIGAVPLATALVNFGSGIVKWLNERDENGFTRGEKIISPITAAKTVGDITDEIEYAATVNAENAVMEQRLANAKRKGVKASTIQQFESGPITYDQAVAQTMLVSGGKAGPPLFTATNTEDEKKAIRARAAEAISGSFRPDSAAGIGGLIGGAGSIDASLRVQESQLDVLRRILSENAAIKAALQQRNQPFNQL